MLVKAVFLCDDSIGGTHRNKYTISSHNRLLEKYGLKEITVKGLLLGARETIPKFSEEVSYRLHKYQIPKWTDRELDR